MKIAVIGFKGRLGTSITNKLEENGYDVIKIDKYDPLKNLIQANLVVDTSHHKVSTKIAKLCEDHKIPLFIVCTGHTQKEINKIHKICKTIDYQICPNLSVGMDFFACIINKFKDIKFNDIYIYEEHHKNKKILLVEQLYG